MVKVLSVDAQTYKKNFTGGDIYALFRDKSNISIRWDGSVVANDKYKKDAEKINYLFTKYSKNATLDCYFVDGKQLDMIEKPVFPSWSARSTLKSVLRNRKVQDFIKDTIRKHGYVSIRSENDGNIRYFSVLPDFNKLEERILYEGSKKNLAGLNILKEGLGKISIGKVPTQYYVMNGLLWIVGWELGGQLRTYFLEEDSPHILQSVESVLGGRLLVWIIGGIAISIVRYALEKFRVLEDGWWKRLGLEKKLDMKYPRALV